MAWATHAWRPTVPAKLFAFIITPFAFRCARSVHCLVALHFLSCETEVLTPGILPLMCGNVPKLIQGLTCLCVHRVEISSASIYAGKSFGAMILTHHRPEPSTNVRPKPSCALPMMAAIFAHGSYATSQNISNHSYGDSTGRFRGIRIMGAAITMQCRNRANLVMALRWCS